MSTQLSKGINIYEIVEGYREKQKKIPAAFEDLKARCTELANMCSTMGAYGGTVFRHDLRDNDARDMLQALKKSSWKFVYDALNIKHIAPQTHLRHFESLLENPPEFDEENIRSVFKDYVTDARAMSLQAFAEVFCNLDPYYKSHTNVRVGAKGLPKRVIISGCGQWYSSYGWKCVADVINALMRYRGRIELCLSDNQVKDMIYRDKVKEYKGLGFKHFQNGNCHISFDANALRDINAALADYYGEVLPDAYEHPDKPSESKEVAKDLQFYRTPKKVVDEIIMNATLKDGMRVLEPSCGDGAILDGIRASGKRVEAFGVEVHQGRFREACAKGHKVYHVNFLTFNRTELYDVVLMNPPFYGTHYAKHIAKAYELLKPGGWIVCVLPITAKLNHGIIKETYDHVIWQNLPMGSFRESGTNINTVLCTIYKK